MGNSSSVTVTDGTNILKPNLVNAASVTKSDVTVYDPPLLALYVGGTGDVAVRMFGSQNSITFVGVPTGALLPICVDKVLSTGTSASSIVGLY